MDGLGSLPPRLFFFLEGSSLCFPNDAEKKKEHLFWGGALSSLLHGFTKYLPGFVHKEIAFFFYAC